MSRWNQKKISYKRLREKRCYDQGIAKGKFLEKLERANHGRKLKIGIELRLKKLMRLAKLTHLYLGE